VSASKPHAVRHIIDSLRWWVEVIGVDGFRFDLATALYPHSSASESSLLTAIESDSVLRNFKMIAEPWDISRYSLGDFPHPWREWNDRYRDSVRQFWLGDLARGFGEGVADIAAGISGSSDVFYYRGPTSSINFLTAHDGFTLADLTMYSTKRNEANQEDNQDGSNDNRSWNMGAEGPSDDPNVNQLRHSLRKSMFATLLLSAGVPMITMGDEVARSQQGSNNAYSMPAFMHPDIEDSPETFMGGWALPWSRDEQQQDLRQSVSELIRIRETYLADIASEFFTGRMDLGTRRKDIAWFSLNGNEMTEDRWEDVARRTLTVFIEAGPRQGLLLLLNSDRESAILTLPGEQWGTSFRRIFDASSPVETHQPIIELPAAKVNVAPHCAQVWLVTRS
jgi:glycogen operon protein